jgi:hypothetical protein
MHVTYVSYTNIEKAHLLKVQIHIVSPGGRTRSTYILTLNGSRGIHTHRRFLAADLARASYDWLLEESPEHFLDAIRSVPEPVRSAEREEPEPGADGEKPISNQDMLRIIRRAVEHGAMEHHGGPTGEEEGRSLDAAVLELEQLPQGGDEASPAPGIGVSIYRIELARSAAAAVLGCWLRLSSRVDLGLGFRFLSLATL